MTTLNHLLYLALFGTIVSGTLNSKLDISLGGAKLEVGGSLDLGVGKSETKSNLDISLGGVQGRNLGGNLDISGASSLNLDGIHPVHHIQEGFKSALDVGLKGAADLNAGLEGAHKSVSDLSLDIAGKTTEYQGKADLSLGGARDFSIGLSGADNWNLDLGAASKSGVDLATGLIDKTESEIKSSADIGSMGFGATGNAGIEGSGSLNLGLLGKSSSNLDVDTGGISKIRSDLSGKIDGLKVGLQDTVALGIGTAENVNEAVESRLDEISSTKSKIDGEINGFKKSVFDLGGSANVGLSLEGSANSKTDLKLESGSMHQITPSLGSHDSGGLNFGIGAAGKLDFGLGGSPKSIPPASEPEIPTSGTEALDLDTEKKVDSNPDLDVELISQKISEPSTKRGNNGVGKHNLNLGGKIESALDLKTNGANENTENSGDGITENPSINAEATTIGGKSPEVINSKLEKTGISGGSSLHSTTSNGITNMKLGGASGFHFGLGNSNGISSSIGSFNLGGAIKPAIDFNGELALNESQGLISNVRGKLSTKMNETGSGLREQSHNFKAGLDHVGEVASNLKGNLGLDLDLNRTNINRGLETKPDFKINSQLGETAEVGLGENLGIEVEGKIKSGVALNANGVNKMDTELGGANNLNGSPGGTGSAFGTGSWNIGLGVGGKSGIQAGGIDGSTAKSMGEVDSSGKTGFGFGGTGGWNLGLGGTGKSAPQTGENVYSKAKLMGEVNSTGKTGLGFGGTGGWNGWGVTSGWNFGLGSTEKPALQNGGNVDSKAKIMGEVNTGKTGLGLGGTGGWNAWGVTNGWNFGLGGTEKPALQTGQNVDANAKLIGEVNSTGKTGLGFGGTGGWNGWGITNGWNFGLGGTEKLALQTGQNVDSNPKLIREANSSGKTGLGFGGTGGWNGWGSTGGWNFGAGVTENPLQTGEGIDTKAKLMSEVTGSGKTGLGFGGWNGWGANGGWNLGLGGTKKPASQNGENVDSKAKIMGEVNDTGKTGLGFGGAGGWNGWGGTSGWNIGVGGTEKHAFQTDANDDSRAKIMGDGNSAAKTGLGFGGTGGWNLGLGNAGNSGLQTNSGLGVGGTGGWNAGLGGAEKSTLQTDGTADSKTGFEGTSKWNVGFGITEKHDDEIDDSKSKLEGVGGFNKNDNAAIIGAGDLNIASGSTGTLSGLGANGGWKLGLDSLGGAGKSNIQTGGNQASGLAAQTQSTPNSGSNHKLGGTGFNFGLEGNHAWNLGVSKPDLKADASNLNEANSKLKSAADATLGEIGSGLKGAAKSALNVNLVGNAGLNLDLKGKTDLGVEDSIKSEGKIDGSLNSDINGLDTGAIDKLNGFWGNLGGGIRGKLGFGLGLGEVGIPNPHLGGDAGIPNLNLNGIQRSESGNSGMEASSGTNNDGGPNLGILSKDVTNINLNPDTTQLNKNLGGFGGGGAGVGLGGSWHLTTAGNPSGGNGVGRNNVEIDNKKSVGINFGASGIDGIRLGNSAAPNLLGSQTNLGKNIEEPSELGDLSGKSNGGNEGSLKIIPLSAGGSPKLGLGFNFGGDATISNSNGAKAAVGGDNFKLNGGINLAQNLNADLTNKLKANTGVSSNGRIIGELSTPNIGLDGKINDNAELKFKNDFNLSTTSKIGGEIQGVGAGPGLHLSGGAALNIDTEGQEKIAAAARQKLSGAVQGVAQGIGKVGNTAVSGLKNLQSDLEGRGNLAIEAKADIGGDFESDGKNSKLGLHLSVGDNKHGFEAGIGEENGAVNLRFGHHKR